MSSNWINALDACAAAGVLDFDAPAYLLGQPARYVGHPDMGNLPMKNDLLLPTGTKLKDMPQFDIFGTGEQSQTLVQNPGWKKVLFGALTIAGIIAAGLGITKLGKIKIPFVK